MHHGTWVTHAPWCMSGSLTRDDGENVPGIPDACATHNVMYLIRGPWWAFYTQSLATVFIIFVFPSPHPLPCGRGDGNTKIIIKTPTSDCGPLHISISYFDFTNSPWVTLWSTDLRPGFSEQAQWHQLSVAGKLWISAMRFATEVLHTHGWLLIPEEVQQRYTEPWWNWRASLIKINRRAQGKQAITSRRGGVSSFNGHDSG